MTEVTHFLKWVPPRTKQTFEPWEMQHAGASPRARKRLSQDCANQFQEFLNFHKGIWTEPEYADRQAALGWALSNLDKIWFVETTQALMDSQGTQKNVNGVLMNSGSFYKVDLKTIYYYTPYVGAYFNAASALQGDQIQRMAIHELTHAGQRGSGSADDELAASEMEVDFKNWLDSEKTKGTKPCVM